MTARSSRYRFLLAELVRRELSQRYAGSLSGVAWTFLQPLAQLAVFSFVFTHVFRAGVPAEFPGVSYAAFVAIALWPWIMFSESILRGMTAVSSNAGLIRKVAVPSELFVYATVAANALVQLAGFVAVLIALRAFGEAVNLWAIPAAIVLLVPYFLLATGVALVLAALQTLLRDVEHGAGVVLNILFYATPILYPLTLVPADWRGVLGASPIAQLSVRLRDVLLGAPALVWGDFVLLVVCAAIFAAGLAVFRRLSPFFEDFL